jgi:hypothetical protein
MQTYYIDVRIAGGKDMMHWCPLSYRLIFLGVLREASGCLAQKTRSMGKHDIYNR